MDPYATSESLRRTDAQLSNKVLRHIQEPCSLPAKRKPPLINLVNIYTRSR